jgi:sulfate permease, SulP family
MTWTEWAPGVAQFRGYKRAWLRGDLLAGLTVAAYLIPQVMAYATLAGLSPIVGLWAALAPLLIYALLGSSRHMSVGPESTTALMVVAVLTPFASCDASRYAALAAVLGVLVGAICFLAGIARLGFLANLLSRPVLVGYMTGVALVMMASQLGKLTGASVVGDEFVDQMRSFARGVGDLHWPTMLLAGAVLAFLLALHRWAPRVPGPLIAVVAAAAAVAALSLESKGIVVVGSVPSGLPTPAVPLVSPRVGGAGDSGGRDSDRRVLGQHLDGQDLRYPPWLRNRRQR